MKPYLIPRSGLILALLISFAKPARAINFHDHIYSIFLFDEIMLLEGLPFEFSTDPKDRQEHYDHMVTHAFKIWTDIHVEDFVSHTIRLFGLGGMQKVARVYGVTVPDTLDKNSQEYWMFNERLAYGVMPRYADTMAHMDFAQKLIRKSLYPKNRFDDDFDNMRRSASLAGNGRLTEASVSALLRGRMGETVETLFGKEVLGRLTREQVAINIPSDDRPITDEVMKSVEKKLSSKYKKQNIKVLCEDIAKLLPRKASWLNVLRSFFEFSEYNHHSKFSYLTIESVRRNYLEYLQEKHLASVLALIQILQLRNRAEIGSFSISISPTLADWATSFRSVFPEPESHPTFESSSLNVKMELLYSIPRYRLLAMNENAFTALLEKLARDISVGSFDGVDITASVSENLREGLDPTDVDRFKDRLKRILSLLRTPIAGARTKLKTLRLHAFEASNKGSFYESIKSVLGAAAANELGQRKVSPIMLKIGHSLKLSSSDINWFKRHVARLEEQRIFLIFEANPLSNYNVQGARPGEIVTKIEMLVAAGLRVQLGADGYGVFAGKAGFSQSLEFLLDHGLSLRTAVALIVQNIHHPVSVDGVPVPIDIDTVMTRISTSPEAELRSLLGQFYLSNSKYVRSAPLENLLKNLFEKIAGRSIMDLDDWAAICEDLPYVRSSNHLFWVNTTYKPM